MKTTSITIPEELYGRLKNEARKRGCPMSHVLREALERQLDQGCDYRMSLRDIPRKDCGQMLTGWTRDEIYDEMIGDDLRS